MLLLLSFRFSNDSRTLGMTASQAGWDVERMHEWKIPDLAVGRKDLVIYGEHLFAEFVAERTGIKLVEPADDLLQKLPYELRLREVSMIKLKNARAEVGPKFIKPPGFKNLKAMVYSSGAALPNDPEMDDIDVLVSDIVDFAVEFRVFILAEKIVDFCAYARDGKLNLGDGVVLWPWTEAEEVGAIELVNKVIASGQLPEAVALDVGLIRDKGWAVVEANPSWGSGIYGCDPTKILPVLAKSVINHAQ